jgi:hypothetical protein
LRDNFADLQRESAGMLGLGGDGLVVDIGSNDGTLLSNFKNAVMDYVSTVMPINS